MTFEIKQASRKQAYIKIGLFGPSGSGKTLSALIMAYGMTNNWDEICVIDTENGSANLYSDYEYEPGKKIGKYSVLSFEPPYSPERYIEAIDSVVNSGKFKVLIIDSITHEWNGKGGILEDADNATGGFSKWKKLTPRHTAFIDKMLQCEIHVIVTGRTKQEYAMIDNGGSGYKVEKVGMGIIQREGIDYEFTLTFSIDIKHNAEATKDRTGIFMGMYPKPISIEIGKTLIDWNNGLDVKLEKKENNFSEKIKTASDIIINAIKKGDLSIEQAFEKINNSDKYDLIEKQELIYIIKQFDVKNNK